jgi:hypothetical protein
MTLRETVPPSRTRRRVVAALASLAMGAVIVVACSSPDQPPLETSIGGGSSSGQAGGSSSGVVGNDSGPGVDGGVTHDGAVVDGGEHDADATTPTDSGLTQAADSSGFPTRDGGLDIDAGCGIANCSGCCDISTGQCHAAGTANNACGIGGNRCQDCTTDGGTCEALEEGGAGGVCR